MNESATVARPNTRDMLGIHQVFRDAFGCAPQLVGSVCGDPSDRVDAVAAYYANVLAFLQAHHEGEDELVWPRLRARAPEQAALVESMQAQHKGLAEALGESRRRLAEWTAEPDIDRGASLAAALATLGVLCAAHFDEEERKILPLAAEHLTVAEWSELPAHGMRSFSGDKPWLVFGLIQEQMEADSITQMESHMPPPVRERWLGQGRAAYQEFVTRLRG